MKLKRILPAALSLALIFSLAACGGDNSGDTSTPPQNETTPAQSETTPAQAEGDFQLLSGLEHLLPARPPLPRLRATAPCSGSWTPAS